MHTIRRAAPRDIPRILQLLVQVDLVHHRIRPDLFKGPATKYSAEELRMILAQDSTPVFVSVDESDQVQGYAFCVVREQGDQLLTELKTLYIDDICVDEAARGQHIGTDLYEHVCAYARGLGCYNVTLNVWTGNDAAQSFYENLGMKPQKICMETIL